MGVAGWVAGVAVAGAVGVAGVCSCVGGGVALSAWTQGGTRIAPAMYRLAARKYQEFVFKIILIYVAGLPTDMDTALKRGWAT